MRKAFLFLTALLMMVGNVRGQAQTIISNLNQLSDKDIYFIKSQRCFLLAKEGESGLFSSNGKTAGSPVENHNDPKQQFRIIKDGSNYYLFNQYKGQFVVKVTGGNTGQFSDSKAEALSFVDLNGDYWQLKLGNEYLNSQDPNQTDMGLIVDSWSQQDEGNRYTIYKVNEDTYTPIYTRAKTRNNRKIGSFSVNNDTYTLTDEEQLQTYVDKSTKTFVVKPGSTVTLAMNQSEGGWMNAFVYVDTDKNGFTAGIASDRYTPTGDLVSYSFYNQGYSNDENGYNSAGTTINGNNRNTLSLPSFTAPSEPGTYRMRAKYDWCNINPDGVISNYYNNTFLGHGAAIIDFTLVVDESVSASQELIDKARAALEKTGLGYPKSDCQTRETLSSILDGDAPQHEELTNALNAYLTSTNIQLPENGKAYTFNVVHKDGTKFYLKYEESGVTYQSQESDATSFVCRTLDNGKFAFVNNDGKYLVWKGESPTHGYNSNKGYTDSYTEEYSDITIKRIYKSNNSVVNIPDEDLFGLMVFGGKRKDNGQDGYTIIDGNGSYSSTANPYYTDTYSSAIQMTEVSYPNTVTLASFEGSQLITNLEGNTIGTFSAPFPTLMSDGNVVAYYAEQVEGTEYVKLKAIATTAAIPAKEGVILVGTTAETTSVLMVPATSEQQADLSSNLFSNSAGHKAGMQEGDFVLARGSQGIGFYPVNIDNSNGTEGTTLAMNKAFLRMGTSNVAAFRLVVDEEVTAIDGVTTEKADAPIYDLSGRRVLNTIKGGIYIQNGKKFIVK